MATPQFFPIPPQILSLACETITRRVEPVPFTRNNITVTNALVGIAMECLNAEPKRTLPIRISSPDAAKNPDLAGALEERLESSGSALAPVIAKVLVEAEIAEPADVPDRASHTIARGVRLLPAFSWHNAAPLPQNYAPGQQPDAAGSTASWLAKCPVCRTGILQTITGRRLYGVPPTDFYHDCTHCGAKFIPEKERFRLVSIARVSDPLWRSHLNTCRTPDEWESVAQEVPAKRSASGRLPTRSSSSRLPTRSSIPLIKVPRKTEPVAVDGPAVSFPKLKDGTITVQYKAKTLYFKPVPLQFVTGNKGEVFAKSARIVSDVLDIPVFSSLKPEVGQKYAKNLLLPLGRFVAELRQRSDSLYRHFLNRFGEEEFSTFRVQEEAAGRSRGVMLIVVQGRLCYITACHAPLSTLIDDRFGRITPDMCFIDGDETACRMNALISGYRSTSAVYLHALTDDAVMDEYAESLAKTLVPANPEQ